MVGYNKKNIETFVSNIAIYSDDISTEKTKITASYFKILNDFDKTIGIQKDVFSILFILAIASYKSKYKFSDKSIVTIFNDGFSHDLNRALYSQDRTASRIKKPSEFPSWILFSFEKIVSDDFSSALVAMAIEYNMDIDSMLIGNDKLEYYFKSTDILSKNTYIEFEEIANASRDYEIRQAQL